MIEVKDVKYDPNDKVVICGGRFKELLESEDLGLKFYELFKALVLHRYVENFACFGNGGAFTCTELAELLHIELPEVHYVGMDEYLKIKRKVDGEAKNVKSKTRV